MSSFAKKTLNTEYNFQPGRFRNWTVWPGRLIVMNTVEFIINILAYMYPLPDISLSLSTSTLPVSASNQLRPSQLVHRPFTIILFARVPQLSATHLRLFPFFRVEWRPFQGISICVYTFAFGRQTSASPCLLLPSFRHDRSTTAYWFC